MTNTPIKRSTLQIQQEKWDLFSLRLQYKEGRLITFDLNQPFLLDDPAEAWVLNTGSVDVFLVTIADGEPVGSRQHLFRANGGDLLIGMDLSNSSMGLLVSPLPETKIVKILTNRLQEIDDENPKLFSLVAHLVSTWANNLSIALPREGLSPKQFIDLTPDKREVTLPENSTVRSRRRTVWIKVLSGSLNVLDSPDLTLISENDYFPVATGTWLRSTQETVIKVLDTEALLNLDKSWFALDRFHDWFIGCLIGFSNRREQIEREQLARQQSSDQNRLRAAFVQIASTLGEDIAIPATSAPEDALLSACLEVGAYQGLTIRKPAKTTSTRQNAVLEIARASRVRTRQVALRGEWWKRDNGPVVGYMYEGRAPVALLPTSLNSYELYNPATQTRIPVDENVASQLYYFGEVFYRPFATKLVNAWNLIGFGMQGVRSEFGRVIAIGVVVGLIQVAIPLVTGYIFDHAIPTGSRLQLVQLGLLLTVSVFVAAALQLVQYFTLLRIESTFDGKAQSAIWDRLLELPIAFFRNYTAGDLGSRAMSVTYIRRIFSGPVSLAFLSGFSSLFSFALLFYYDVALALLAGFLVFIAAALTTFMGYLQVRQQRTVTQLKGKLSGYILQLINGVAKFRVAGVENQVFAFWADKFGQQRHAMYQAKRIQVQLNVLIAIFPTVALATLFGAIVFSNSISLTVGEFLGFQVAFIQFMTAGLQVAAAFIVMMVSVPLYERLRPIIQTPPEVEDNKVHPGELTGEIEISHVSFRYQTDGPLVLNNVSININPGEFVAFVGPSGSGKSTLLRLMLGFDKPESGSILYDGQDTNELDVRMLRRQIGVVLQNSQLMSGNDIFTNIVGVNKLTMEDAWEAAENAGFADDVRSMPMEMQTVITEGGSTLSGGQRQRLLIARAIVTRPRVLFFDEATSALDNKTQAIVSKSLEALDSTRIVIAHRLSTIMNADRIVVIHNGEIVEQGTYDELMKKQGVFADLAKRQIV